MRKFPVLHGPDSEFKGRQLPSFVDRSRLSEQQAERNHSQSLDTLARRGGLSPREIAWNVMGLNWRDPIDDDEVVRIVNNIAFREVHENFQYRVQPWLLECFGDMIAGDREERNHRFLEEALELVQACGCTAHEAHQLVDYVFGRHAGDPPQEVGGVMVTLAALCLANSLDMHQCGETELERIWTKTEEIRAKQAAKPKHSPLPL